MDFEVAAKMTSARFVALKGNILKVSWPGNQTSKSYVLAAEKPVSPAHNKTLQYGKFNFCKIV
jgi:hypothetical protein